MDSEPNAGLRTWLIMGLLPALLASGCAGMTDPGSSGGSSPPPLMGLHTLKELRDLNVVKQALDYSCGAAALATLMIYYYGEVTSEADILGLLQSRLTAEELAAKATRGFSLLDLKQVAQLKGYQAAGFRLSLDQLEQLAAPVLVYVEPMGYKHFAVLRGVKEGRVYLADPSRGNLRMSLARFADEWKGNIIFVLGKAGEETLVDYPLRPPQAYTDIRPEWFGIIDLLDQAIVTRTLPLRGR